MLIILQLCDKMNNIVIKGSTFTKVEPFAGWNLAVTHPDWAILVQSR